LTAQFIAFGKLNHLALFMKCHETMLTEQVNAEFELPTLRTIKEKEQDHRVFTGMKAGVSNSI